MREWCLESANWKGFCFSFCWCGWLTLPSCQSLLTSPPGPAWVFPMGCNLPEKSAALCSRFLQEIPNCSAVASPPWACSTMVSLAGYRPISALASRAPSSLTFLVLWLLASPLPCDILPFKYVSGGTVNLADGFNFCLQWVCCGTSCVQHRAVTSHKGHLSTMLLPKPCHRNPTQLIKPGSALLVYRLKKQCCLESLQ